MNISRIRRRAGGFSLIELMISVVIGLLAVMFATRIMTDSERTKDGSLAGSDSMQNGMTAMFSISADAEQAGFNINDPLLNGCDLIFEDTREFEMAGADGASEQPLAPAVIVAGGTGSDQLSLYAGSSQAGNGTMRMLTNYNGGSQMQVDRNGYGFSRGDVIVVTSEAAEGKCALAQISGFVEAGTTRSIAFGDTSLRYNTGALGRNFTGGVTRIFNLGPEAGLSFHTWSVSGGVLRLRGTNLPGASAVAQPVADNIVAFKAQYGLDTRTGTAFEPEKGMQVSAWSATMTDADGDGTAGGPGDYQRIAALRIAVVARSKTPQRPDAQGNCDATPEALTVFERDQPSGVSAVPAVLDLAVAGDTVNWRCYRYRAFETIVPLRNAGWRPTA